nr:EGF receptor domain containing protein [Haemonchus contortus]
MEDVSVDVREHIKGVCDDGAQFSARQCRGGMVDEQFLRELDKFCNVITGNLFIRGFRREPKGLDNLRQVKKVRGRVVVKDNAAIKDLSFLSNMEEIDGNHHGDASLHVFDNRNFGMRGLYSIRKIRGDVVIKTEKKEDVPEDMKNRLISVTDGSVKFLTASDDMRRPDETTETSEILTEATEHTLDKETIENTEGVLEKLISTTTKDVEREGTTTSEDTDQMRPIFPERDSSSDKITMSLKKSNFKKERTGHLSLTSRIIIIVGVSLVILFLLAGLIILVIVIAKSVSKKKQRGSNESAYVKSQSVKPSRSETNQESLAKPSKSETNQESLAK